MKQRRLYFSTRDLLMMAALAALGGVVGTYANAIGDVLQSALGFAGSFQWAAGLHVVWLTLAVGLTGKHGAGTVTGLLKGCVELLTGNTHGLLVLLVDVVAGVLVDLGFVPFRRKDSLPAFCLAGGLAAASNVLVFQLFASLPADLLAYGAIALLAGVAGASGVLLGGVLAWVLLSALRRAGVVKEQAPLSLGRRAYPIFLAVAVILTALLAIFLRNALRGPSSVRVSGAVQAAYAYPQENGDIQSVTSGYSGIPLRELVARARPDAEAALLLIRGSDGYAFFVSMDEVRESDSLLLSHTGEGEDASYNIVGAKSSKADVRGVTELVVIRRATLPISGALGTALPYDPTEWTNQAPGVRLDVGEGQHKYQGIRLGEVLDAAGPVEGAQTVVLLTPGEPVTLELDDVLPDKDLWIFTIIGAADIRFAVARTNGDVVASDVTGIEVR